jgi:hypothetical protein
MTKFIYEYTDTFSGEANYSWVKRGFVTVPELTHYGYDGSHGYGRASSSQTREAMRKVKAELGLTGISGEREEWGDVVAFRPRNLNTILFIECE